MIRVDELRIGTGPGGAAQQDALALGERMARFAAVAERVRAEDPMHAAGPADEDAAILLPGDEEGGAVESALFIACEDGVDVARVAAMLPTRVPGEPAGTAGALGFWSCAAGHEEAGGLALEAARRFVLARRPAAVGPLDLSTWHRYRFVVEGYEQPRFLLEPWNRAADVTLWERAGFERRAPHATVHMPLREVPVLRDAHERALDHGVRFVDMTSLGAEASLAALYDVVRAGFEGKEGFAPLSRARFDSMYAGVGLLLTPGLSFVAVDGRGAALGFAFGYPDHLEPLFGPHPDAAPTTTVLKTLARRPDAPSWLGYALCHQHIASARAVGFEHVLFALMERWAALMRVGRSQGAPTRVVKKYALFRSTREPS
jgi:hypothetical protein